MAPRGNRSSKKPPPPPRGKGKGKRPSSAAAGDDPFFEAEPKRRRARADEDIESGDSDDDALALGGAVVGEDGEEEEEEVDRETAGEKRMRMTKEYLERIADAVKRNKEEEEEDDEDDDDEDDGLPGGRRVAKLLRKKQLVESGRQRLSLAARVLPPGQQDGFKFIAKHRQPVTAVALSKDSDKGFSASKDGVILHWDVETGKSDKYLWPTEKVLVSHHAKAPLSKKRSQHVLALAVSSDGRYLATGGFDRHIHLWDVRSREHIQAFSGHRGAVSCLAFGLDSSELFSGSYDRSIMQWNAEDRTYMHCLYGHQGEILTTDALSKDRLLTVARDRTMHLWKIPEESQLVFRAPAVSLECCCFIDDKEYLSGSDDGSLELWSVMRKKPTHIIKNAHPALTPSSLDSADEKLPKENGICKPESLSSAHSWVSAVAARKGSDLAASGAANGVVRLWTIQPDSKGMQPLFDLPLDGFVNSLAIAKSGRFIVAGVGREPRLGKWGRVATAKNGVAIHRLSLQDDSEDL
uniref:Predicted protein n=1 Tax=Hordeum vulgare subsp. vulgare TaxID=112509 RepID=F2E8N7_HORVV|nr:predicted protein [Hordeum vulgare subsp. vulgare]